MLIDSHCHLNYKGLVEDQAAVLERARAAGVGVMRNISTREYEWNAVLATADRNPDICATVGIHPHETDAHPDVDTAKLKPHAAQPKIDGLGQTGLAYYYEHSDTAQQQRSL